MAAPDEFPRLLSELRSLPKRQQRAVLGALPAAERGRVAGLLLEPDSPRRGARPPEDCLSRYSPWLRRRIELARSGPQAARDGAMTAATRRLLVQATEEPAPAQTHGAGARNAAGPSLVGAMASLLRPKRGPR